MGIENAAGTRLNQAGVTTADPVDPERVLTIDLYRTAPWGAGDQVPQGALRTVLARSGDVVRQSVIDSWFPDPTVATIAPATGAAAGGTVVTITGANLDGVTAVTFDGAAGTALSVLSATQVQVTTPAHAAGAVNVVLTDDGGSATVTNGYTYA